MSKNHFVFHFESGASSMRPIVNIWSTDTNIFHFNEDLKQKNTIEYHIIKLLF